MKKLLEWIKDYYLQILIILIPFFFAIAQFLISDEGLRIVSSDKTQDAWKKYSIWAMVFLGVAYIVVSVAHTIRQQKLSLLSKQVTELQKDLESWEQDFDNLVQGYVLSIAKGLKFGTQEHNTERITIYSHDSGKLFVPFGRFSWNTEYIKKGRDVYPDHQGCIAKAWQHGRHFCNDYPDWNQDAKAYIERVCKEGYSKEEAKNLAMKSRLFYGWRVLDSRQSAPLAVVLIESTDVNRWNQKQLDSFFEKQHPALCEIVERVSSRLPKPTGPGEAGF